MIALVERASAGLLRHSVALFDGIESSEAWPVPPCLHIAVAVASEGLED